MRCRREDCERKTLPLAVILNRFLTAFFVLLRETGFGIGRGSIEKTGQILEIRHEHADGSFVKRDGHDFGFSGWHRAGIWSKSSAKVQ